MKKTIVLTVANNECEFIHTTEDYNNYINDISQNDKVAPARKLLTRIVKKDQREKLTTLLDELPGATIQLAAALNEEFAPAVDIEIKK